MRRAQLDQQIHLGVFCRCPTPRGITRRPRNGSVSRRSFLCRERDRRRGGCRCSALLQVRRKRPGRSRRRSIAASLAFLKELAAATIESARVRPGQSRGGMGPNTTGMTIITPGGNYPALWTRDFAMSLDCGLIGPAEILRASAADRPMPERPAGAASAQRRQSSRRSPLSITSISRAGRCSIRAAIPRAKTKGRRRLARCRRRTIISTSSTSPMRCRAIPATRSSWAR